jgi:hypothetical protein
MQQPVNLCGISRRLTADSSVRVFQLRQTDFPLLAVMYDDGLFVTAQFAAGLRVISQFGYEMHGAKVRR